MKFYLKLGLILLAFCIVATGILAYVNSVTKPKIDLLKKQEAEEARAELIPNADFDSLYAPNGDEGITYYAARDKTTGALKGYTFTAVKYGYSSNVKAMAAVDTLFNVIAIKVVEQAETPGLGANCLAESFTAQFKGKTPQQLKVDKDGAEPPNCITSMTGATITTRAITNSLKETIDIVKKDVEQRATQPKEEKK